MYVGVCRCQCRCVGVVGVFACVGVCVFACVCACVPKVTGVTS